MIQEAAHHQVELAPQKAAHWVVQEATVLFADIEGFVALSRRLGDGATYDLLDRLFREFDSLCAWHGVRKIKTIGDGYMAVAGIEETQTNHGERVARLAIDMLAAAADVGARLGLDLKLRIGIATGPLTAGHIGLGQAGFDVWGNTVNLAARLEGRACQDQILISAATRLHVADHFDCGFTGQLDIRGIGLTEVWSLGREHEMTIPAFLTTLACCNTRSKFTS